MMFHSPRDRGFMVPKVCRIDDKNETVELYACDICSDGGWTSETEVEIHKTYVHYTKSFRNKMRTRDDYCHICMKQYLKKESVVKHIKTEHLLSTETCLRVEREIFICDKCSSIFFNKQNLYIHLRYAHLNMRNMQQIRCVLCMKKIKVSSMPAHFYSHNLQSVTTCRICLCKYKNTKALAEHLKKHPYYLKCDICCYNTTRVEIFQNHILTKHKNSVKINSMKDTKKKKYLKEIKKKGKNKQKNTTESAKAVENLLKDCAMDDTNLIENNEKDIDKDLITLKYDDSLTTVENLMFDQVKDDPDNKNNLTTLFDINGKEMGNFAVTNNYLMADDVIKNESSNSDLMIDEVISGSNLMTLSDINGTEMGNFAVTNNYYLMADDVIKTESSNSDLMIDEVMSDSNIMTVIEINDQDVIATDTAAHTNLTENVKTDKDFVINDGTITEVSVAADSNLTDTFNPVKDLVSNDITVTKVKIESDTNLIDNVKPIKDLMSSDIIITKANTDNVICKLVKDSEHFKKKIVPDSPSLITVEDLMSDQVKDDPDSENNLMTLFDVNGTEMGNFAVTNNYYLMADDVIKNESSNSDLMIDEVISGSNLMSLSDVNGTEMGNFAVTNNYYLMADDVIKNESSNSDLMIDEVISGSNLMTLSDINGTEMGNFAVTNNDYLMADDVIKNESSNSDLMIDEVISGSNLMTVIEISDQDGTATDTAANTSLTENVKTDKDFVINDGTITEVSVAADSNLTDTFNPVKDLVSNDITVTKVKIESDTNLTDNVKPIKDLISSDITITKANTDNVISKPAKDSEHFKRFFVPDSPSLKRLQRIVGIRGIRLSNDVHICILCREICVGFEEMRSHVDEHTVIVEKSNSYECSCGEKFTMKILLRHHAFKSKHFITEPKIKTEYE